MVSLVDIVPQKRTVQIAAGELELHGLGLRQIASLLLQFPSLRNLITEAAPSVDFAELLILAPDAIASIIAEAAGQPEATEAVAEGNLLTPDEILDCLTAIQGLTFPRGIRPLLQRLGLGGPDDSVPVPAGKAPATSTPPPPSSSSPPDMMAAE
jgi:hypothetical protein